MRVQITPEQAEDLSDFLEGPDGCDFQQRDPEDAKTITWRCDGTLTKTSQWLSEHGLSQDAINWHACCDCEVLFNMPESLLREGIEDEPL